MDQDLPLRVSACTDWYLAVTGGVFCCRVGRRKQTFDGGMEVTTAHRTLVVPLSVSEALMDGGGLCRCPFSHAQTKAEK